MKQVKIVNITSGQCLAGRSLIAHSYFDRLKGLLGRKCLEKGEGLVLDPCSSVHCIGMKFTIDVIFVSKEGTVVGTFPGMKPFHISPVIFGARYAVELPEGTIKATHTQAGDIIKVE